MKEYPKKNVIIGAGPAGLSLGSTLSVKGNKVTVLEKADKAGGMALSFKDGEYIFDLGPHNFHTVHKEILAFVKGILKDDLRQHYPTIKIFFMNKFVSYPLKGIKVFTVLPLRIMIPAIFSFLFARARLFFFSPKDGKSFESWIKNRFGNILYGIYFGPYAQKAWVIKAAEISRYVAEKRVPSLSISDYIRNLFNKTPKSFHSEDVTLVDNYYPRKGIGQITEWLHNDILENDGQVELNVEIVSIDGEGNKIKSVTYRQGGNLKKIDADMFFSTIPINDLIKVLRITVPEAIREAAQQLDYVSEVLLFLKVKRRKIFDSELLYFSSPKIKFNRIYDIGAFSKDCVPSGKTAYCVEFTCNMGDDVWNSDADILYRYVMDVFEKHNLMFSSDVEGYLVRKIEHAYPRFKIGFEKRMKEILEYLSTIDNLVVFGRQGFFCYANIDDALYMGQRVVDNLDAFRQKTINYLELFPEYARL